MAVPKLTVSSLTSKFQATIPGEVRACLQLKAGDKVRSLGHLSARDATALTGVLGTAFSLDVL